MGKTLTHVFQLLGSVFLPNLFFYPMKPSHFVPLFPHLFLNPVAVSQFVPKPSQFVLKPSQFVPFESSKSLMHNYFLHLYYDIYLYNRE